MLNSTVIIQNLLKPESSYVVRHGSVITDTIRSQAFLFGELDMGKRFIRKDSIAPLCACGCGERVNWNQNYKGWNKFITSHNLRTPKFFKIPEENAPSCACGCGEKVKWDNQKKEWNKFIFGHAWIGRKHTSGTRKKLSEISTGYKHTQEARNKISKAGEGRIFSKKARSKISDALMGNKNGAGNWQGGKSFESYCFIWSDKDYKQSIKDRDNNECQNPDCHKNCDHLSLELHHINYNKKACNPWDLITVCKSCNCRANFNREHWKTLYQNIMTEKYGYEYN